MASPQKEHGFAPIARELLKALARARFTPAERACIDCVIDATYGWQRRAAKISRQQFVEYTGYSQGHLLRTLRNLRSWKVLCSDTSSRPVRWMVNKDYERWMMPLRVSPGDTLSVSSDEPPLQEKQEASTEPKGSAARTANAIVELVMNHGLNGERPPNWGKQHKAARRLVNVGVTLPNAERACQGMKLLFPWKNGDPWDVFTLERDYSRALAAQRKAEDANRRRKVVEAERRERLAGQHDAAREVLAKRRKEMTPEQLEQFRRDAERRGLNVDKYLN